MKFAHFSHVWNKPNMTAAMRYEQLWRELALADESDFDFGFCVEHHFNPTKAGCRRRRSTAPRRRCATIGCASARWVTSCRSTILTHRLRTRAVLDNVANGRFELGLVAGIVGLTDFSDPMALISKIAARSRTRRWVFIKQALSAEGAWSFTGEFRQY